VSLGALCQQLGLFIPPGLVVEFGVGDAPGELFPEERAATEGWAPHRLAQFALGRACARRALGRLGVAAVPILFDREGAPAWPSGTVGSISHKRQNCMIAVGSASLFDGVGVDLEVDFVEQDENEIVRRVCPTPRERSQVVAFQATCQSPGTLFLAAKEAFFKLQFPISRARLDWDQVEVTFHPRNAFTVCAPESMIVAGTEGIFQVTGGWIAVLAFLQHLP